MAAGHQDTSPTPSRKVSKSQGLTISVPNDPVLVPLELNLGSPLMGNKLLRPFIWSPSSRRYSVRNSHVQVELISRFFDSETESALSEAEDEEENGDGTQYITICFNDPFYNPPSFEYHSFDIPDSNRLSSFSCDALIDEEQQQAAREFHEELARMAPGFDDLETKFDPDCLRDMGTDLLVVSPTELIQDIFFKSLRKRAFSELHPNVAPENSSSSSDSDDDGELFVDCSEVLDIEPSPIKTSTPNYVVKPIDLSGMDRRVVAPFEEPEPEVTLPKSGKLRRMLSRKRFQRR
ncbi:hypothetical protein VNI00_004169 [Paramarasmius palmivorus]|uniref:Uncharacterized protein n=1 Tax=Paramarasmius palmivorus TaxID=297713 RepID=A0AAW0DPG9_9AGAR